MARQGFKRAWTRTVPEHLERSVYVLAASAALIVMFLVWRPIPNIVWDVTGTALELPLWVLFATGWLIVLLSTFLINHFELFGLQQAWFHMRSRQAAAPQLRHPFFYRWVAHPALRRLLPRLLGDAEDDVGPSALRGSGCRSTSSSRSGTRNGT